MTFQWKKAVEELRRLISKERSGVQCLDHNQRDTLAWMADRLPQSGLVLADEVGTGKTRIACAVVQSVLKAGGRVAVVVPHGLIHQWKDEAAVLGVRTAKCFSSVRDFIEEAKECKWEDIAPCPDQPEWLLISHGFRAPRVRYGHRPAEWRVALPAYVRAKLSPRAVRGDRRTVPGKLLEDSHETTKRVAQDIVKRVEGQGRARLRTRLDQLPPFRRGGNNEKLIEALQEQEGREVVEELIGLWLGEFDLLVIDEAHKSRGEVNVDGGDQGVESTKVLPRLVDVILKQPKHGRRLCLTATPMELELSQWNDLIRRTRSEIGGDGAVGIVDDFRRATQHAARAPDEIHRLEALAKAARRFEAALKPCVTRRRRVDALEIREFQEKLLEPKQQQRSHPHRNVKALSIPWTEAVGQRSRWRDVLFAAECMSQSARGLTLNNTKNWPRAVRDAYTKLSAGHVSIDLADTGEPLRVPEVGVVDDHTRGKVARTAYWYQQLREARRGVLAEQVHVAGVGVNPDAEHPRVLAAVKEIEYWTSRGEKVLVFGVFLRPLRVLTDVLNVRRALRDADAGRPSAFNLFPKRQASAKAKQSDQSKEMLGIAYQQLAQMRAERDHAGEPVLKGQLASADCVQMRQALVKSHEAYKKQREKVRRRAKREVRKWQADPTLLGGATFALKLVQQLEHHLVSFVVDDLLSTTSASDEVTDQRFAAVAAEFVANHLRPQLDELGGDDDEEGRAVQRQRRLQKMLRDDDGRQSLHARILKGEMAWETRRYLQAAFNRRNGSPLVLVAQSQVGREGLNLHKACRVVLQFHAEWNPAILEQQIGRVDRKGSHWEALARAWIDGGAQGEPPFIEVRQLVLEGTYDAFQWERVMRRQHLFDASLFGSLLPSEAWHRVPPERVPDLLAAAPSFRPPDCTDG